MGDGVCTNSYQHVVGMIREVESLEINTVSLLAQG